MVTDYISRDAAINAVYEAYADGESAYDALEKLPAADVRPVVRGRWEYNPGDNIPYCSECMMPQDSECYFCPNCGAMMEES